MAFVRLDGNLRPGPTSLTCRIRPARGRTLERIELSIASYQALGEPRAVFYEWDDTESLLRIGATSPTDSSARRMAEHRRVSFSGVPDAVGLHFPEPVSVHLAKDGPLALIANLSEYRSN